ncbi:MAG: TIM-barrel domain-containing protein [Nitriliruptoraceae bacterium]
MTDRTGEGGRPYRADAVVRDLSQPLLSVRAVEAVATDTTGVTLTCRTDRIVRRLRDRTGTALETAEAIGDGPTATLRIEAVSEHILRVRAALGAEVSDGNTELLDGALPSPAVPPTITEDGSAVGLTTGALHVRIDRDPYRLLVTTRTGERLVETLPAAVYLSPPTGESHLDGRALSDAWPWFFRGLTPLGWTQTPEGAWTVSETAVLSHGEALFGFGERFLGLDKRGQRIDLWHANAAGQTWPESYKNVPFHLSSRGYGVFLNTTAPITYHLGDTSATHQSWHVAGADLDWFLIAGPDLSDVLERYTDLTGKPALPPRWSYGLWMSRMSYREQGEVETVAAELRARRIPADVIHIDTDWFATPWVNDLRFCPERFPDPARMTATLREQGFRVTLWQLPYLSVRSELYTIAKERGYLAMRDGDVAHIGGFFGEAGVVDFSNPDAADWYVQELDRLFDLGIAAIKTDFGEGAPEDASWHGVDGVTMHNLYPLLYNRAVYERTLQRTGEGLIWGRSATAGSQRYPVYWGGDPAARWEDLGNVLAGGLSLALCGFPFWSQDIGAFAGEPTEELYIRWAQAGLFMTHPRAHGAGPREPWAFGERAESIFRRWAGFRYQLLPYVWGEAERLAPRGQPVMRPLVLDHTDDPTTYHIHDQFLLGRWLLVAPVVTPGTTRRVYLPAGRWVRWSDGEVLHGPRWHTVEASLEEVPLFLADGALVPRTSEVPQHTGEVDLAALSVTLVPPSTGGTEVSLLDPRSEQPIVIRARRTASTTVELELEGTTNVTLELLGDQVRSVRLGDAVVAHRAHPRLAGSLVDLPAGCRAITLELVDA